MSWVAELNASNHKNAKEFLKKSSAGMVSATPPRPAPINNCIATIQARLVFRISTSGLQNGFMTQGKYSQLVYRAISVLDMPSRLYMMTDTAITTT